MRVAQRVSYISPSLTLAIIAKAKRMKKEGIDVISLGAGELDVDTPSYIKEAAYKAMLEGFTKYTPADGIDELKEAVISKYKKDYGISYEKDEVIICCGAKHALFNIAMVLFEEGDEVILPVPYWVTYPQQINLMKAKAVFIETKEENNFEVNPEDIESKITKKTKAMILNNPTNPTGAVYSEKTLSEIADIAKKYGIFIIYDECYEKIVYDGKHINIVALREDIRDLVILVNAVSKTYSMTGWRIGFALGNREIISYMKKIQSHQTSNPTSISQKAALAAILSGDEFIKEIVKDLNKKRTYTYERLTSISSKISCFKPSGTFYIFPNVSSLYNEKIKSSSDFADFLLTEAKVAVIPGAAFGNDEYIRISYTLSWEKLEEGLNRIEKVVTKL